MVVLSSWQIVCGDVEGVWCGLVRSSRRSEPQNTTPEKLLATSRSWKSSTLLPTADCGKRREDRLLVLREPLMLSPHLGQSRRREGMRKPAGHVRYQMHPTMRMPDCCVVRNIANSYALVVSDTNVVDNTDIARLTTKLPLCALLPGLAYR